MFVSMLLGQIVGSTINSLKRYIMLLASNRLRLLILENCFLDIFLHMIGKLEKARFYMFPF